MKSPFFLLLLLLPFLAWSQNDPSVEILTSGTNTSLRGLCVVNDQVIWVSGSNGTVGKSTNGGKDWKWLVVRGFEKTDFRDIEAFSATTAVIMAVGEPGYILRTIDGGETWKVVFENKSKGMFLDALTFWNEHAGIVIGDPIDGRFYISRTFDGGATWKDVPLPYRPVADSGEACFAASGTNVAILDRDEAVFVSGGLKSRIFIRNEPAPLPIIQGKPTAGAYSVDVYDFFKRKGGKQLIVVGGDYRAEASTTDNCFFSNDRGKSWKAPKVPPHGYRSCVEYLSKVHVLSCGPNGVDFSYDAGNNWKWISREGFHVCKIAKIGRSVFLAGSNGRVARLNIPFLKEKD